MQVTGIHHIAIICSDYARSKHFYSELLGFAVIRETYREARDSYKLDLRVNEFTQLELFSFPQPPARSSQPEACGLRHLCFGVMDLAGVVAGLEAQGLTVEPIRLDDLTGKRYTFFHDPDGLPLELYEV